MGVYKVILDYLKTPIPCLSIKAPATAATTGPPLVFNQRTMLPDNGYGVYQYAMKQNWFIINPSSKHYFGWFLTKSYAAEQILRTRNTTPAASITTAGFNQKLCCCTILRKGKSNLAYGKSKDKSLASQNKGWYNLYNDW